jgi:hypothetical protein
MNKPLQMKASRRAFLGGAGGVVTAAAASVTTPAAAQMLDTLTAAQSASVVLHDPRIPMNAEVAARLVANGARIIELDGDAVRQWRTEIGAVLSRPDTRLFGLTRWADLIIVRGLAAESRRHMRYEQHHPEGGHFTWLIA